jgi:hypothetical protein
MDALNKRLSMFQSDWHMNAFIVDDARAEINNLRYRSDFTIQGSAREIYMNSSCWLYMGKSQILATFLSCNPKRCGPKQKSFYACGMFVELS